MFFVFKQKRAYELGISDWCSDVCSSDLRATIFSYMGADRSTATCCARTGHYMTSGLQMPRAAPGGPRVPLSPSRRQRYAASQFAGFRIPGSGNEAGAPL